MEIGLNGKKTISAAATLMALVKEQGLDPSCLIAEYNFKVVPEAEWPLLKIREGDQIEFLSFVGGG